MFRLACAPPDAVSTAIDNATIGSAITHLVDCTALLDTEGRILTIDDTVPDVFGHEPTDMVGTMIWDYVHLDDLVGAAEVFERELTAPGYREANPTLRCRHKDRRWRYCEVL